MRIRLSRRTSTEFIVRSRYISWGVALARTCYLLEDVKAAAAVVGTTQSAGGKLPVWQRSGAREWGETKFQSRDWSKPFRA
jgi:hypothetical protein